MTKLYSLILILMILVSCKSDSFIDLENQQQGSEETNFNFGNSAQRNFNGLVLSTNGSPVSGATVTIGSATAQTNFKGIFVIKNADVKENFAYVKVTKAGFVNGSRTLVPTTGSNRINIMMIPATNTATIATGTTATVSLPNGTKVKFDGSFKDANGNAYSGSVNVAMFHLKSSDQYLNELMPGSFLANNTAGNARVMETYGMLHVQLTGASGQNLQIANGHTAEMTMAIDAAQTSTSPATIPLWSFEETTGIWQEDGSATKVGNAYVGNVSHFSWWNCDVQFPQSILKVTVKNSAGAPMINSLVTLKRASQTYESYGYTDNVGTVSGIIPANEMLVLKVYDVCNTVVYTSNVAPVTAGTTMVLPDIVVTTTGNQYTIQGNIKTCANTEVTDGYAILRLPTSTNYFQFQSVPLSNTGNFSFTAYSCAANTQMILEGYDYTNLKTTGDISFIANSPVMNFNNLVACNAVNEFISYKIDNQNVRYILGGINAQWSGLTSTSPNMPAKQLRINSFSPAGNVFSMVQENMLGTVGSFSTDHSFEFSGGSFNSSTGNVVVQVTNFGAVGTYIDFTVYGTYTDTAGNHTFTATGHVMRDF
ncbi:hypothetical protein PGH12_14470 [Chryseobacterium wangxinyae]|uniref:hypothetical protein n=1 Tax=Chryseobacterium sp. CY350 TaxID=2997336 RepID=UPI002270209D|nr:hypothetical protein [Chryseobacterium sp. CY350]MCY0975723.1 hypothetical protein [Chryseobacterium sp. CY350]WBZ94667.1 hypothetical protein PGH12_14470 [Chryseobacterium sp. CY350]